MQRPRASVWPESWSIAAGGLLLGALAWVAFTTRVPNVERQPAEVVFAFLGLYFYSAGFLAGRRTGQAGKGSWAGAVAGLAFGIVVCVAIFTPSIGGSLHETVRGGAANQVAIAWSGLLFFVVMGTGCGWLGARAAIQARRQHG
jgi:hypothetical protein